MKIIMWLLVLFILNNVLTAPPKPLSSTYQMKQVAVGGIVRNYAIAELDFDQDIYLASNMVCSCVPTGSSCESKPTNSQPASPPAGITTLAENQVVEADISWGQNPTFQFNFPKTSSCQNINIVLISLYGSVSLVVSNTFYPTAENFIWFKSYYNQDRIRICNSDPKFSYGFYAFQLYLSAPYIAKGRFKVYWYSSPSIRCGSEFVPTTKFSNNTLLTDSAYFEAPSNDVIQYNFFEFQIPQVCSNFAVSVRKSTSILSKVGEMDLFISLSDPRPTLERFEYQAAIEGDDTIALINLCSPTGVAPWPIYIAAQSYGGDPGIPFNYSVIATAKYGFEMTPISDFGLSTSMYILSTQTFGVQCATERFDMVFPPFARCYGQNYTCAYPIYPLGSVEEPSPILPLNVMDDDLSFINKIDWGTLDTKITKKNRLTIAMLIDVVSEVNKIYTKYISSNISSCSITFANKLGNKGFENIVQESPLTLVKPTNCTEKNANTILNARDKLLQDFRGQTTLLALQKVQVLLANLHISHQYSNCTNYYDSFFTTTEVSSSLTLSTCDSSYHSDDWFQDPCCNQREGFGECCPPKPTQIIYDTLNSSNTTAATSCGNKECIAILSQQLISQTRGTIDPSQGCDATFVNGNKKYQNASFFIDSCRIAIIGRDLNGIECTNNGDCIPGFGCIAGRCNHTYNEVISCMANTMDPEIGQLLFTFWGIASPFNVSRMENEIRSHVVSPSCQGPNSFSYRDHWEYVPMFSFCSDDSGCELNCFSDSCPLPPECSSTLCVRTWQYVNQDLTTCVADSGCNWNVNCTNNCQAACSASPVQKCLDCSGITSGSCKYIPGINSANSCLAGYCNLNHSIVADENACKNLGRCYVPLASTVNSKCADIEINNLIDPTPCTGQGRCSSLCELQPILTSTGQTGVCISPTLYQQEFGSYCSGSNTTLITEGCVQFDYTSETTCQGAGYIWRIIETTQSTCESVVKCFDNVTGRFNTMSASDCSSCGFQNKPVYSWIPSIHMTGTLTPLTYATNNYGPIRKVVNDINYVILSQMVEAATALTISLTYSNYETCLYGSAASYLKAVSCDCQKGDDCYSLSNPTLSEFTACSYSETINFGLANITIFNNSIKPTDYCLNYKVVFYDEKLFQRDISSRLSSEIFLTPPRNTFSVVKDYGIYEGQIISNGIGVTWVNSNAVLQNPIELCIPVDSEIPIHPDYTQLRMGRLTERNVFSDYTSVRVIRSNKTVVSLCGMIRDQGVYANIIIYKDFQVIAAGHIVMCCIVAFGYFCLGLRAIYVCLIYVIYRKHMFHVRTKSILCFLMVIFAIIRGIYFILIAIGVFEGITAASYVIFEFPTFLYLVMYSAFIYLLADIAYKPNQQGNSFLLYIYLLWILFIAIVQIVFLITYYVIPSGVNSLPCVISAEVVGSTRAAVSLSYVIVIAVFGVILAAVGFPTSFYIHQQILKIKKASSAANVAEKPPKKSFFQKFSRENLQVNQKLKLYMTLIVGTIFTIFFLVKSAIYIALSVQKQYTLPIIVFGFLEIIPCGVFLYYLRPSYSPFHKDDEIKNQQMEDTTSEMGTKF